jgi:hypothetical protein
MTPTIGRQKRVRFKAPSMLPSTVTIAHSEESHFLGHFKMEQQRLCINAAIIILIAVTAVCMGVL